MTISLEEKNRRLLLCLGMAVGLLKEKTGADFEEITAIQFLFDEAEKLLDHLPCAILPDGMLIPAGLTHSQEIQDRI